MCSFIAGDFYIGSCHRSILFCTFLHLFLFLLENQWLQRGKSALPKWEIRGKSYVCHTSGDTDKLIKIISCVFPILVYSSLVRKLHLVDKKRFLAVCSIATEPLGGATSGGFSFCDHWKIHIFKRWYSDASCFRKLVILGEKLPRNSLNSVDDHPPESAYSHSPRIG